MILSISLFALAVALYAISQLIMHKKLRWLKENGTGFWDGKSHLRKYKNLDSSQGPKFLFSTTLLVFLTDGYHLMQFFFLKLFVLAILLYEPVYGFWIDGGILLLTWYGTFNLIYYVFAKKK